MPLNNQVTIKHRQPLLLKLLTLGAKKTVNSIPPDKKLVFILTTGRTGTTYLANLLNGYDDVFAVHEPKPSWRLRMYTMAYLEGKMNPSLLFPLFNKHRQEYIVSHPESFYIESNPFLNGFATTIAKNIPNSHIIHIVRDPRDYIISGINHGALHGKKAFLNRYLPYWQNGQKFFDNRSLEQAMVERLASFWKLANQEIADSAQYTDNYLCLKFEELFDKNLSEQRLNEVLNFIGINEPLPKSKPDKSRNPSRYSDLENWEFWGSEVANTVHEICSPLMQTYGYGEESNWKTKLDKAQV